MANKNFIKIWSGILSSLALVHTEAAAHIQFYNTDSRQGGTTQISAKEESKPDLFLRQAAEDYAGQMLFAGHRSHSSHSSHRSHYSSSTYSTSPSYQTETPSSSSSTPQKSVSPSNSYSTDKGKSSGTSTTPLVTKRLDTTNAKMVQLALNLLGYNAGKVDGKMGGSTKTAVTNFQLAEQISATGDFDAQTCLMLARKVKDNFPNDQNAAKLHNNLLRLYLKLGTGQ